MQRLFLTFIILIYSLDLMAQNKDSLSMPENKVTEKPKSSSPSSELNFNKTIIDSATLVKENPFVTPKKTALFSAILPGLGQAYNHQYWKIPIIYAGLGVAAYFINFNLKNYNTFRQIYAGRISGDPDAFLQYPEYPDETVRQARDFYRKNLDLTVLLTAVGYTLQILDAAVFAHLKDFDISPKISFSMHPVAMPQGGLGIGLVMNLK